MPNSPITISSERSTQIPTSTSGPTPKLLQVVGQLIGLGVQFPVGQLSVPKHDRHPVGRALGLLLEQLMHAAVAGIIAGRVVPLDQELPALLLAHERQLRSALVRIGDDPFRSRQ